MSATQSEQIMRASSSWTGLYFPSIILHYQAKLTTNSKYLTIRTLENFIFSICLSFFFIFSTCSCLNVRKSLIFTSDREGPYWTTFNTGLSVCISQNLSSSARIYGGLFLGCQENSPPLKTTLIEKTEFVVGFCYPW